MKKVIILLLIIFYMLIIFQGCSKENFECNLDKTIARVCDQYNNEACIKLSILPSSIVSGWLSS